MPERVAGAGGRSVASATAGAATHLAVGAGLHTLAHGCPPTAESLAWAAPVALVAVAAADRLLSGSSRPVRLAGCQVAVHTVLTVFAVCVGGASHPQTAAHEPGAPAVAGAAILMLLAHAFAVLVCLAVLHHVERAAADSARRALEVVDELVRVVTARLSARPAPAVPQLGRVLCRPPVSVPASVALLVDAPRGPPVFAG